MHEFYLVRRSGRHLSKIKLENPGRSGYQTQQTGTNEGQVGIGLSKIYLEKYIMKENFKELAKGGRAFWKKGEIYIKPQKHQRQKIHFKNYTCLIG